MPRLIVAAGPDAGKQFPLVGPTLVVGRHSANPVPLRDPQVSRRHFELIVTPAGVRLADLGSGNGTRVNDQVVTSADLKPGDRISIGDTVLQFLNDDPPAGDRTEVKIESAPHPAASILRAVPDDAGSRLLADPGGAVTDWLRGRLATLAVLYEASAAISNVLDVDELLDRIMGLLLPAADADRGCVLLFDPETRELMPKAARTRGLGGGPVAVSRSVVDHVLQHRQAVLVSDAQRDERFGGQESVRRHNIREVICSPMRGRHETVGVLVLDTVSPAGPGGRFTEDHLQLAVAVAHQAALAVEETRYYQALLNAERLAAVGQTIAAMSHHIKNIMHGVRFGSDMVRTALADDDRELLAKGWKLVERNQSRIDDLIQDMLSYSKEREPGLEPTDLGKLAADVLDVVRGRAADLAVELDFTPASLTAVCDPEGIHRALLNVVGNAIEATAGRQPARVTVSVGRTADAFEIVVEDTGPGVPAEKAEEIFKPFVSSKGSRGTGLGLPVSRKTLREHGGDLTVESAAGGGARFVLRLPDQARSG